MGNFFENLLGIDYNEEGWDLKAAVNLVGIIFLAFFVLYIIASIIQAAKAKIIRLRERAIQRDMEQGQAAQSHELAVIAKPDGSQKMKGCQGNKIFGAGMGVSCTVYPWRDDTK
jgi:hypothetical protein